MVRRAILLILGLCAIAAADTGYSSTIRVQSTNLALDPTSCTVGQINVSTGTLTCQGQKAIIKTGGGSGGGAGTITGVTAGLNLNGGGTSGTVTLNLSPGSTQYIRNTETLQSGATFYVSSGTVAGGLTFGSIASSNGNFSYNPTNQYLYLSGTGSTRLLLNTNPSGPYNTGIVFTTSDGSTPQMSINQHNANNALTFRSDTRGFDIMGLDRDTGQMSVLYGVDVGSLTVNNITGTQCLHSVSGVVSGTGSDCGAGGGGSGTINAASQFSAPYYSLAGSSNVLSGFPGVTFSTNTGVTMSTLTIVNPGQAVLITSNTIMPGTTVYADGTFNTSGTENHGGTNNFNGVVGFFNSVFGPISNGTFWRGTTNNQASSYDLFGVANQWNGTQTFTSSTTFKNQVLFDGVVLSTAPVQITTNTIIGQTTTYANGYIKTDSTMNAFAYTGGGLATCGDATHALSYDGLKYGCQAITATASPAGVSFNVQIASAGATAGVSDFNVFRDTITIGPTHTVLIATNAVIGGTTLYNDGTIVSGGTGDGSLTLTIGGTDYGVTSSSVTDSAGVCAQFSGDKTLIPAPNGAACGTGTGGGGGYNVEPATVTFNLAKGVIASTMTVSSNTIIGNTTFYADGTIISQSSGIVVTGPNGITNTYGVQTGTLTLAAMTTPTLSSGTIALSSDYNAFVSSLSTTGFIPRLIWLATSSVRMQNLATGTTVTTNAGAGSNSNFGNPFIEPNHLQQGKSYEFFATGYYGTSAAPGPRLRTQVKIGTFTVCDTGATSPNSVAVNITSSPTYTLYGIITTRTTGITGTVYGQCSVKVASATVPTTSMIEAMTPNTATTTVDTTLGNMLNIVMTWSAANARNLLEITNAWIKEQD